MFQISRKLYSALVSKHPMHFSASLMAMQLSELNPTKHNQVNYTHNHGRNRIRFCFDYSEQDGTLPKTR